MKYDYLGKSNCKVSKICLGTMHFGPTVSEKESFAIMDRALELGINFFDTADIYGGKNGWGLTESIIGKWLAQGGERRDKIILATKVYWADRDSDLPNHYPGISGYKVHRHAAGSLRRLQTDHIDLYQVHHLDRRVSQEEFWGAFERLHNQGDITYVGSSNFSGWALAKYQQSALQRGFTGFVSEQTLYNLICRYPELEVIPAAQDFGIGILAYMPLGGGLLSGKRQAKPGSRTEAMQKDYGVPLEVNPVLDEFSKICAEIGQPEYIVATAWVLANPAVSSAIAGVRTVDHLEAAAKAAEIELDSDVMERLNTIFNIMRGRPLRNNNPAPEAYAW
jgi:aryl-alcohol dehydrogenase-like predicted oxidoreductase